MSIESNCSTSSRIGCLVLTLVGGSTGKSMQREVDRFIHTNGLEWTCARHKALWNAAIHLKNGDPESARLVYQQNSIAYHKDTMYPKGVWGYAVRQFVQAQRPSVVKRWAAALRIYTSMKLDDGEFTKKQQAKAITAIRTKYQGRATEEEMRSLIQRVLSHKHVDTKVLTKMSIAMHASAAELHGTSYYYSHYSKELEGKLSKSATRALSTALKQPYGNMIFSLLTEPWVPDAVEKTVPGRLERQYLQDLGIGSKYVGRLGVIQEQGCKARVVFQPTAAIQMAFKPLDKILEYANERYFYREAVYKDQKDAAYTVHEHLARGHQALAIDARSATDRFPRAFSRILLEELGLKKWASAMEELCSKPVECDYTASGEIYYECGQPMGAQFSFRLYNLSHCVVAECAVLFAQALCSERGEPALDAFYDGSYYRIVGDDIVISDERIAKGYKAIMYNLGVTFSEEKCFSKATSEIVGFMSVPTSYGPVTFRPYKIPDGKELTNPIEFLDSLGVSVAKLSPKWNNYYKAYSRSVPLRYIDLSPIVSNGVETKQRVINKEPYLQALSAKIAVIASGQISLNEPFFRKDARIPKSYYCLQEYMSSQYTFAGYNFTDYLHDIMGMSHDKRKYVSDYEFDPREYARRDRASKGDGMRRVATRLQSDPLFQDALKQEYQGPSL